MEIFNKIITLSKQIAKSLLNDEKVSALDNSEIFSEADKDYILKNLTEESLIKERLNLANQINKETDFKKVEGKIDVPVIKMYWRLSKKLILIEQ